jgi:hypothetical protein
MARAAARPAYPNLTDQDKVARTESQARARSRERQAQVFAAELVEELRKHCHVKLGAKGTALVARFLLAH